MKPNRILMNGETNRDDITENKYLPLLVRKYTENPWLSLGIVDLKKMQGLHFQKRGYQSIYDPGLEHDMKY